MLEIFPFLGWIATAASAVLLVLLWRDGELRARSLLPLAACFVIAGYCQFFGRSALAVALGQLLQTTLAIGLILRSRWTS